LLLEHLALATNEEVRQDPALNFEFAHNRIKNTDLAAVFYERLMKAENRETFIETFGEILRHETQGISKALDKIYPRPDPTIKEMVDEMSFSIGSLEALKGMFEAFQAANAQVGPENQLKPAQPAVHPPGARLLRTLEGQTRTRQRFPSGALDSTLKVWDLDRGLLIAIFHCDAPALCCAFVDGQRTVAGGGSRVHTLAGGVRCTWRGTQAKA
jgi:hypothetical protein